MIPQPAVGFCLQQLSLLMNGGIALEEFAGLFVFWTWCLETRKETGTIL